MINSKKVTVLGVGNWGTVLAHMFESSGHSVVLWGRSTEYVEHVKKIGRFTRPVELNLPEGIEITSSLKDSVLASDLIVCAVPSEAVAGICEDLKKTNVQISSVLSATKGLDKQTQKRMSEVWLDSFDCTVAVLSGPNLSTEAALAKPMKTLIASEDMKFAQEITRYLQLPNFKTEITNDVIGTEISGATKNVIALIAGAWDGLNLGTSGKGAMLTRAVVELSSLVELMGGKKETAFSVAGLGDLYITCSSSLSRNYQTGYSLGQGKSLVEIQKELKGQVSEGVWTAPLIHELVQKYGADFKVCEAANKLVLEKCKGKFELEEMLMDLI